MIFLAGPLDAGTCDGESFAVFSLGALRGEFFGLAGLVQAVQVSAPALSTELLG